MLTKKLKYLTLLLGTGLILNSCVSTSVHEELQKKYAKLNTAKETLEMEKSKLTENNKNKTEELESTKSTLEKEKENLKKTKGELQKKTSDYNALQESYNSLVNTNSSLLERNDKAVKEILEKLKRTKRELQLKEDKLARDQFKVDSISSIMDSKNKKILLLEKSLADKDNALKKLKSSIADALSSFTGSDLDIYIKDGKIYISMDNKMLFGSGSWVLGAKGKKAINHISNVIAGNNQFGILIEGHTDNQKYMSKSSSGIKDNWDLSVKRATEVVKYLLKNKKIDPSKVSAAGRGEFSPIAPNDNAQNRSKNRRIEVILYPNIEKLNTLIDELSVDKP